MTPSLPSGWVSVRLGEVVEVHDARRIPVNADARAKRAGPYPYYGANGQAGTIDSFLFDGDYALLAEDGGHFDNPSRGVAYRVTGQFWVNNHAHILAPRGGMETTFLVSALNALDWMPYVSGSTRLKLTQGAMTKAPLAVPPLNEQRRIVAKLEALQFRSRRAREALDAVPPLLEKLRQSILAAAFRGDLTKDWRAKHKDVEPASKLLERIRAERRRKWEEGELAKMKAKGKAPTDDKWKAKYKTPKPVDATALPALPATWSWGSIELAGDVLLGRRRAAEEYVVGQDGRVLRPYVRVANVKEDRLVLDDVLRMPFNDIELQLYRLKPGDIILSEGQSPDLVGQSSIFRGGVDDLCIQATVHRFRAHDFATTSEFAQLVFLNHLHGGVFQRASALTTNIAHLTSERLRPLRFPLPPLEEQSLIVERARRALAYADSLVARHLEIRGQQRDLERSILAKAFRGEIVPQDPNDEPAEAMLARLRETSAASENGAAPTHGGKVKRVARPKRG